MGPKISSRFTFLLLGVALLLSAPAAWADGGPFDFFTLPAASSPCRVFDSRFDAPGPFAGGIASSVQVAGALSACGVPASAKAVAFNVTVVNPTAEGYVVVYGDTVPPTSTVNFKAGQTRANNAVLELAADGTIKVKLAPALATADIILDVSGYFQNGGSVLTPGGGSPTFTEDGPPVVVDPGLVITDNFSPTLASALVTITNPQDSPAEVLAADAPSCPGLTVTPGPNNLTITGTQPLATYQTCLRSVTYSNSSQSPNTTPRVIAFTVDNGIATSNTVTTTVDVLGENDAPTDIALNNSTVQEQQPAGTPVGTFSTTDPDVGDTFTYTLVAGAGSTDNASFQIVGNQLQTATPLSLATQASYSIRVRSTDAGGLFFEKVFTITLDNVNDAPTDIGLSPGSVAENQPVGTTVGTFSTTDPDPGDTFTYTLVAGAGSTDNASFTITGNQLQTAAVFDFETKSSYSIRVRSTDAGGLFFEKVFTVTVTDANESPTDIALSPSSVAEGQPSGTAVGTFSTTDPDAGDTFTYTLVPGVGSTDNASFTITGNTLQTGAVFDFETKSSYSIRVRSTDAGGLFFEKVFTVTVTDGNDGPTDIALSPSSVAEDQPAGTAVGTFSTTDPDAGDTFTYTLVPGAGSTDNASFTITGNTLQTGAVFDFETKSSYSIRVRSTDSGGLFFEKVFTITVTNGNEAPTDIGLSPSSVAENQPAGTAVGAFSTTDPDVGDTFTYTLVAGAGSTDNGSFTITGNTLQTAAVFDFEAKSSYSIRVRSTDAGGLFFEKVFTITVTNVNEAPTDIALSPNSVAENQPANTVVGTFSTTDPDAADTFTYTLVAGAGSTDNGSFTIAGNQLRTAAVFDFETKSSYSIRVRSTDAGGLFFEKVFTITVTNVNEAPTDIALSPNSVAENQPAGTAVGTFSTIDQDAADTFTYTLVAGAGSTDNGSFTITGNTLQTTAVFDFETKSSYSIRVRSTDSGGLFFEKVFTITVTNVNEAPTNISLSPSSVAENQPAGTAVGTFSTTDQDAADTFTYTLVAGAGSTDNGSFTITGNTLQTAAVFDFETKSSYSIRVRSTDSGGLFFEKVFTITVTNVNEAPTDISIDNASVNENQPAGTAVGNFSTTDPDPGDTFTYTLVAGAGSTDNASFQIVGNQLRTAAVFDFEAKSSYSIRVRSTDSGGLFFEKAFTITIINVPEPPIAGPDSYETVANVKLEVAGSQAAAGPKVYVNGNVLANDIDPDGPTTLTATLNPASVSPGATVVLDPSTGEFTYVPPAGKTADDTFTYTLSDGALTGTGTVTIHFKHRIWFVKNNGGGGAGRSSDPFATLLEAQNASGANDTIYVFEGDGATTGQNAGIILKAGQRLLGEGVTLDVPAPITVNGVAGLVLRAAGNKAHITNTNAGGNGVSVTNIGGVIIRGLDIAGNANAVDVTTSGTGSADATISNNVVSAAGAEGIDVTGGTNSGTTAVTISNNTISSTGNGIDATTNATGAVTITAANNSITSGAAGFNAQTLAGAGALNISLDSTTVNAVGSGIVINGAAAGTTTITTFANNAISGNTGGSGIVITSATFDNTAGGTPFDTVSGGSTVIGASGNGVGASGMTLTNVQGALNFADLDIFADGGAGLRASGTGAFNGSSGLSLSTGLNVSTIEAVGGPAVDISAASINLQLASIKSTNSATTGVSLVNVADYISPSSPSIFTAGSGSSITNATGTDFNVDGGNATITYPGTISDTTGRLVSVANTTGDTKTFSGAITDSNSGTGQGILLNSNTGATISFTGPLTLSTGSNAAFTATAGGTVTATDTTSTLTTTTGTALNVSNTTIGGAGLKFKSISAGTAASGPTNGIVLNNTGSLGGLTVSGTGSAGSGGTIRRGGTGISLTSTNNVSLSWMQLNDFSDFAIRGITVNGFSLTNSTINGVNGDNDVANEGSVSFDELTGSASLTTVNISGGWEDNFRLANTTGTLNRLTLTNCNIGANSASFGNTALNLMASGNAVVKVTVTGSTFTGSRSHFVQFLLNGNSTPNGDFVFTSNTFTQSMAAVAGAGDIFVSSGGNGNPTLTYNIQGNTMRDAVGNAINVSKGAGTGSFSGTIDGNTIGVSGVANSGSSQGNGIAIIHVGGGTHTTHITNNTIRRYNNDGILVQVGDNTSGGNGTVNATITGNTVKEPDSFALHGLELNIGTTTGDSHFVCASIGGAGALKNDVTGAGNTANGGFEMRPRQRQSTTIRLPGYGGAATDTAAVASFLAGQNTTSGAASISASAASNGFVSGAACP